MHRSPPGCCVLPSSSSTLAQGALHSADVNNAPSAAARRPAQVGRAAPAPRRRSARAPPRPARRAAGARRRRCATNADGRGEDREHRGRARHERHARRRRARPRSRRGRRRTRRPTAPARGSVHASTTAAGRPRRTSRFTPLASDPGRGAARPAAGRPAPGRRAARPPRRRPGTAASAPSCITGQSGARERVGQPVHRLEAVELELRRLRAPRADRRHAEDADPERELRRPRCACSRDAPRPCRAW